MHRHEPKCLNFPNTHPYSSPSQFSRTNHGHQNPPLRTGLALPGGQGIAKLPGGMTALVTGALPGETVLAVIKETHKTSVSATALASLSPPDHATTPQCKYERDCGGCVMQRIEYAAQLDIKSGHVIDALVRNGGLPREAAVAVVLPALGAPAIYGYRNKMEFSFSRSEWDPATGAVRNTPLALGFHRPGSASEVLAVSRCALQDDSANDILTYVRSACREEGLEAFPRTASSAAASTSFGLTHLTIRKGTDPTTHAPEYMAVLSSRGAVSASAAQKLQRIADALARAVPGVASVVHLEEAAHPRAPPLATRVLWGRPRLHERLLNCAFDISPASFFQTNTAQAQRMYELAREYAGLRQGEALLDLYCGTGTFALTLAAASPASAVTGVDISASSIADAKANALRNGVANASFIAADLEDPATARRLGSADVVVVDPARAGLSRAVVAFLRASHARAVVYVSCSAPTFGRDVKELTKAVAETDLESASAPRGKKPSGAGGARGRAPAGERPARSVPFRLVRVQPLDMFAHTAHCELVALLEREL